MASAHEPADSPNRQPLRVEAHHARWSIKLGRIAGVDVFAHAGLLFLLAWVGLANWGVRGWVGAFVQDALFVAASFGVVVLHELGHVLAARRFGIRTRRITLLPIGGVAMLERLPERPVQEILVALAGPAVNVGIATILWGALAVEATLLPSYSLGRPEVFFGIRLLLINLGMALFNLIPAFPLDGGRVLRAMLAFRMDRLRATEIAARVGLFLAALLGLAGLLLSPILALIALFVALAGREELLDARLRHFAKGFRVRDVLTTNLRTASPTESLQEVARDLRGLDQAFVPVLSEGRLLGIVATSDLRRAMGDGHGSKPLSDLASREFRRVSAELPLEAAFDVWDDPRTPQAVVEEDRFVGLLLPEGIAERLATAARPSQPTPSS